MERLLVQEVKRDQANLLSFSIPLNKFLKISQNVLGSMTELIVSQHLCVVLGKGMKTM